MQSVRDDGPIDLTPALASRLFGDDTSPAVAAYLIAAYRRMSGAEKIARVRALNRTTVMLAMANIRQRHPDADEREVLLRLACRHLGPDLVREKLGWDVRVEGY